MSSVNKVILIGNLGADPEVRFLPSGQPVANFNIATTERWTNKNGEPGERTEWHRIVVFGKQAENCKEYLKKGRQVYVEGGLRTREWEDKQGQKRRTTEIVAQRVQFLGGPRGEGRVPREGLEEGQVPAGSSPGEPLPGEPSGEPSVLGSSDDDIPF